MAGTETMAPGWYADPFERHQSRYWDGSTWTAHVADHGVGATDLPPPSPPPPSPPSPTGTVPPPPPPPSPRALVEVDVSPIRPAARPKPRRRRWILLAGAVAVAVIVIVAVANKSDGSSTSSGGGSFKVKIADQAVFLTADYGDLGRLADASNAPSVCDSASQSLQQATAIVAGWSADLRKAWSAAEGHFETALTACRAGDGQAMARAYGRAESTLQGLRTLLSNLNCQLDPQEPGTQICK